MLAALNPDNTMPSMPIEVVLQEDPRTITRQFVVVSAQINTEFANSINVSYAPTWPVAKYSSFSFQQGNDGPASYVASTPYAIGLSYVDVADKIGNTMASMINTYGSTVRPSFATIGAGFNERAVKSSVNSSGLVYYYYNTQTNMATGSMSWPYIYVATMAVPQMYARQTCSAKSEMVKFFRWMMGADNIRFSLCETEYTVMNSAEIESQLGVESVFMNLGCASATVEAGELDNIAVNGASPATTHTIARQLLLDTYGEQDSVLSYVYSQMDESTAMAQLPVGGSATDAMYYVPMTIPFMYDDLLQTYVDTSLVQVVHVALFGVVPQFNLPSAVDSPMSSHLPLVIDMETLASVFFGNLTSWLDPRMVARNPALTASFGSVSPTITVVLCGTGLTSGKIGTVIGNHLMLRLFETQAFKDSPCKMTLPVNWTCALSTITANGGKYLLVDTEVQMEAAIARISGSIGYVLSFSNTTTTSTDFQIVRSVVNPTTGLTEESQVAAYPATFLTAASLSTPSIDPMFAMTASKTTDYAFRNTWPILIMMSMAVPTDISASASVGLNTQYLCFRQKRAVKFALWMSTDSSITAPSNKTGRAAISQLDNWAEFNEDVLDLCMCDGSPVLYTPPVIWSTPSSVQAFGIAVGGIGAALAIFTCAMLVRYRRRTIIKVANLPMQFAQLAGTVMLFAGAILFVFTPSTAICNALGWCVVLGLGLMLSTVCIKVLRVYYIHSQRRGLKMRRVSNLKMQVIASLWVGVHLLFLILAQADGGLLRPVRVIELESSVEHYYTQCSIDDNKIIAYAGIAIGIDAVMLIITSFLAFAVRHVSSAFNESRNISWAVWNATISSVICVPLLLLTGGMQGDTGVFLMEFLVLWITICMLIFTFGYKLFVLFSEEIQARRAAVSQSGFSASRVSGGASRTGSGGTTSSGGGSDTTSVFNMPSLEGTSIATLEKYITAIEAQIRMAREKRRAVFGADSQAASVAPTNTGSSNWLAGKSLNRAVYKPVELPPPESAVLDLKRAASTTANAASTKADPAASNPGSPAARGSTNVMADKPPKRPAPSGPAASGRQPIRIHTSKFALQPAATPTGSAPASPHTPHAP